VVKPPPSGRGIFPFRLDFVVTVRQGLWPSSQRV